MKKLYTFLIVLILTSTAIGQTFEWLKTVPIDYEFNPGMIQYTTCTDPEGNIYFFGLQEHLIFYNQAMGTQFLKKYNPEGELLWEKTVTGEGLATGIYCDEAGGIYLYGQMHSNLNFWGELELTFVDITTNGFLVKLNYDGEIDWGINLEDLPMESGTISDVSSDNSGLLFAGYSTWINSHILKFSTDGDYIGSIDQEDVSLASGIDVDANGNIYATGGCAGFNSKFGGVSYPAPFPYSSYIVKYNPNGEPQWVKFIEDITCSQLKLKCDNSDNVYVAGQIFAETNLDTIIVHGASWVYDFFLTRLNPDGEFLWVLECPEVLTGDATVGPLQFLSNDSEGNALLAGFTRGIIDWGNGIVTNSGDFYYNIIVWNVSPTGEINWVKTAGGEGYDDSHGICTGPEGDVYIAGVAGGTAIFDTITYVTDDYVYPFLAKIDMPTMTRVNKTAPLQPSILYPNPASDNLFIRSEGTASYVIFNSCGETMAEGLFSNGQQKLNVNDFAPGIYFILLKDGHNCSSKALKFMVK